jgi:NAD(P)-dependent dehydrogenase (short-subunit alcohol dehydrogenase family)
VTGRGAVYKGVGDVGVEADVIRNYDEALKVLGRIDVLVLNAGLGYMLNLEDYSADEYDEIFNTNVRGVFLWLKAALPGLKVGIPLKSTGPCTLRLNKYLFIER